MTNRHKDDAASQSVDGVTHRTTEGLSAPGGPADARQREPTARRSPAGNGAEASARVEYEPRHDVAAGKDRGLSEAEAFIRQLEAEISCVGRERMFQYFSGRYSTPALMLRLNYAIDLRYGVLHDIARKVWRGEPIDLASADIAFTRGRMRATNLLVQSPAGEIRQ